MLNVFHFRECGGHIYGMDTTQKILCAGYFWPSVFKVCHEAIKKLSPCQHFYPKKHTHPALLHPVIAIGPFAKWGIEFMHCNPTSAEGHGYIIVAMDYFTKWAEARPTYAEDGNTAALFLFNHIITRFGVLQSIITDHGSHFHNQMMEELSAKLGFRHENSAVLFTI